MSPPDNQFSPIQGAVDRLRVSLTGIFLVALIGSLGLAIGGWGTPFQIKCDHWPAVKIAQAIVLALWIGLPPAWFWLEYFYGGWEKNPAYGENASIRFERFKYGQDISSKIWLAVSSVLLMLYFGKDIRG